VPGGEGACGAAAGEGAHRGNSGTGMLDQHRGVAGLADFWQRVDTGRADYRVLRDALAAVQAVPEINLAALGFSAAELADILAAAGDAVSDGDAPEALSADPAEGGGAAGAADTEETAEDPADANPEPPRQAVTRPGDLWLLGEHRLLCGDSTDAASVARVMGEDRAALLFTSPPYGNQRDYTTGGGTDWDALMQGVFQHLDAATDTRFVVTNLTGGTARTLYEDLYCRRGQAENHIKSWKTHIAADRFVAMPQTMPPRPSQPVAPDAAHRRLLADVIAASLDAGTIVLAGRAIRYAAIAAAEDRSTGGRVENQGDGPPTQRLSQPSHPAPRPETNAPPGDLNHGAVSPRSSPSAAIPTLAIRTIEPTPAPEVRPARAQPIGEGLTGEIQPSWVS